MSKLTKLLYLIVLRQANYKLKLEKMKSRNEKLRKLSRIEAEARRKNETMYAALGDVELYKIKNKARKAWFRKKLEEVM